MAFQDLKPAAALAPDMNELTIPAPLWRRLAATVYDVLLLAGLWLSTLLLVVLPLKVVGFEAGPALVRALLFAVTFGFFSWFWTHGGQTLGMRAWRLQLRRHDGGALSWPLAMRRFAWALLLWLPGWLWLLVDTRRLAWHDRLSATELVLLPK